jgi:hypothetical protein
MKAIKYTGTTPFVDKHNGTEYVFEPGRVTKIPDEAARHLFGIGGSAEDKYLALRRSSQLGNKKWLDQFKVMRVQETIIDPATKKPLPAGERVEEIIDDDAQTEGADAKKDA